MKRSEINASIRSGEAFMAQCKFHLPEFAHWALPDWQAMATPTAERNIFQIFDCQLGWDATDFGLGNFTKCGLLLFTIRNGKKANWASKEGKLYCEKIMVATDGQETPMHFHWTKMEDIINRGGAPLHVTVHTSDPGDESVDMVSVVNVTIDGVEKAVPAGTVIVLTPGQSITLTSGVYHTFRPVGGTTLIGEVSIVNDDDTDNRFANDLPRFPTIIEDEPPYRLLMNDYATFLK